MDFLYGEKINGLWYFFRGPYVVIPREMVKNQPLNKPLNYAQLHNIALKEVYGGYLTGDGDINEHWFTAKFESAGWGDFEKQENYDDILKGKRYKTSQEFFEQMHLFVIGNNWNGVNRDSIKLELLTKSGHKN